MTRSPNFLQFPNVNLHRASLRSGPSPVSPISNSRFSFGFGSDATRSPRDAQASPPAYTQTYDQTGPQAYAQPNGQIAPHALSHPNGHTVPHTHQYPNGHAAPQAHAPQPYPQAQDQTDGWLPYHRSPQSDRQGSYESTLPSSAVKEDHAEAAWPKGSHPPARLKQITGLSVVFTVGDIVIGLAPTAFIVLGVCAALLNGKPTKDNTFGKNIEEFINLAPTIFPILFAAVAGRFMKASARYFAERGANLGTLELLMASQTVWGTFESLLLLKNFSTLGAHLLFLWALSPIGGQASLRVLETTSTAAIRNASVSYLATGGIDISQATSASGLQTGAQQALSSMNGIYTGALLASTERKNGPTDIFGNAKIPWYSALDSSLADAEGWIPTDGLNSSYQYSALIGIPVAGLEKDEASRNFSIESAYMTLDCPNAVVGRWRDPWWKKELGQVWGPTNGTDTFQRDGSNVGTSFFLDTNALADVRNMTVATDRYSAMFNDSDYAPAARTNFKSQRYLLVGSKYLLDGDENHSLALRNCTLAQEYVESQISCNSTCRVTRMRKSVKYSRRNPLLTPLDSATVVGNLARLMPFVEKLSLVGMRTSTEYYVEGYMEPFTIEKRFQTAPTIQNLSPEDFGIRFGSLLNTYFHSSLSPAAMVGNTPDVAELGPYGNSTFANGTRMTGQRFYGQSVLATVSNGYEIYKCNYLWLALMEVSTVILLLVGTGCVILKSVIKGPDMIGYVASMTYDNRYIPLPPGGVMGGMERSQALRRMRVRVCDVQPTNEFGHVALAMEKENIVYGPLRKDRLYV